MMMFEKINLKLKNILSEERYQHSWQVSKLAEEIAESYHIPSEKAKISGLIHDCAKDFSYHELQNLMEKYHIHLTEIEKCIPGIWHAYVGAELAKELFEIHDQEMFNAIKYHSTGFISLSLLGKIVYVADKIEPGRKMNHTGKIKEMVWSDIDQAMLVLLNLELEYLISKNEVIHPNTFETRNKILYEHRLRLTNEKNRKTESIKEKEK